MKSCIFNWSGGKDSSLALYHCLRNPELDIKYLVTTINDAADRISMHGVRTELLIKQAESIGIQQFRFAAAVVLRIPGYEFSNLIGMRSIELTLRPKPRELLRVILAPPLRTARQRQN